QENSDECAWISPGTTGGAANINFGSFGTYAEQASWSNDTNSCAISHPIVNHGGGNTVSVTNPGSQTSTVGTAVSLQISGSDSAGASLTYSASGLPAGLSISSSGLISGTPTTAATSSVTVTAKDSTGASGSASFSWTVNPTGGGGGNAIVNGGFESGSLSGWTASGVTSATTSGPHSGSYSAQLGNTSPSNTSSVTQNFTAASGNTKLTFWYDVVCPDTVTYDWATATLKDNTTGTTTTVLAKTCVSNSGWVQKTATIVAGHSYTLTLTSKDDNYAGDATYTRYDDVATS
ncbi:MAG TPA: putative Ig domain-containing protein, partial [Actinocrinis sp.]|nr:putative Ig domain-containing protein [Actinocrinis sp.]